MQGIRFPSISLVPVLFIPNCAHLYVMIIIKLNFNLSYFCIYFHFRCFLKKHMKVAESRSGE